MGGNPSLLYATTKGSIIQMTRAMAAHHGPDNIRVNCVAPGMVYTPMVRGRGMSDEMRKARINQNLLKTEGTAWDVGYGKFFRSLQAIRLGQCAYAYGELYSHPIPLQQGGEMDYRAHHAG